MFPNPTPLEIESPDPAGVVLERLRRTAADWRESSINAQGRKMHILRWHLSESEAGIDFAPTPFGSSSPMFRGKVLEMPAGSVIRGELRPWDPTTRVTWLIAATIGWTVVALLVAAVLVAPTEEPGSWVWLPIAGATALGVLALGRGMRRMNNNAWDGMSLAITETLQAAARGPSASQEATHSDFDSRKSID